MASDLTTFTFPHATSSSTYRIPTPPHIVVPPPALTDDSVPAIAVRALSEFSFLENVDYNHIITQNGMLEWTYERRREAQLVLPYLYLGPMAAAKDAAWLRREGITCVLGVRQKGPWQQRLMNGAFQRARDMGIEYRAVDLAGNQDLIPSFPNTTAMIHSHVSTVLQATGQLGKVLVFCESGNERSAGVVAAYLMATHEDVDHIKAMQLCQSQRFCVSFDDPMKRLLQGYWDILSATRQVAGQGQGGTHDGTGAGAAKPKAKRERERDEDENTGMPMSSDDEERFRGRIFVPYVDESI